MFVADVHGCIMPVRAVGGARGPQRRGEVSWLTPMASGGRNAHDGWNLSGVAVDPSARREGVGRALTRARCATWWSARSSLAAADADRLTRPGRRRALSW